MRAHTLTRTERQVFEQLRHIHSVPPLFSFVSINIVSALRHVQGHGPRAASLSPTSVHGPPQREPGERDIRESDSHSNNMGGEDVHQTIVPHAHKSTLTLSGSMGSSRRWKLIQNNLPLLLVPNH